MSFSAFWHAKSGWKCVNAGLIFLPRNWGPEARASIASWLTRHWVKIIVILVPNCADHVKAHADTVAGMTRSRNRQSRHAVIAVSEHLDPETIVLLYTDYQRHHDQSLNHSELQLRLRPMSHLRFCRATLWRNFIRDRIAVGNWACRTLEADWSILVCATKLQCAACTSAYCNFVAWQSCATKSQVWRRSY